MVRHLGELFYLRKPAPRDGPSQKGWGVLCLPKTGCINGVLLTAKRLCCLLRAEGMLFEERYFVPGATISIIGS